MEQPDRKIYYHMGEVCEMLDLKPSVVRFWEKSFDILKPTKNKKGNRLFSPQDVENLKLIYHLVREKGMTLAGAKAALRGGGREQAGRDTELMERLLTVRSLLEEIRLELRDGEGETIIPQPAVVERPGPVVTPESEIIETTPAPEPVSEPVAIPEPESASIPAGSPAPEPEARPLFVQQSLF